MPFIKQSKAVRKYLEVYREDFHSSELSYTRTADFSVVVPAKNESEKIFELQNSIQYAAERAKARALLIYVVNASESDPEEIYFRNEKLLNILKSSSPSSQSVDILCIDRTTSSKHFQKKSGVGLARKTGFDLALFLRARGQIGSRWIHTTDADAEVPEDYFSRLQNKDSPLATALLYPFHHKNSEDEFCTQAIRLYEFFLHYYVAGLRFASSPYAYMTIGSTLAIDAEAYAHVRGIPDRQAGEDFYVLNKLRKIGPVESMDSKPILLSSRISDRVPFGTGTAIQKISTLLREKKDFKIYNPEIFKKLKSYLQETKRELKPLKGLHPFDVRFDAFKTLKFIHSQQKDYADLPWKQAILQAPFRVKNLAVAPLTDSSSGLIKETL